MDTAELPEALQKILPQGAFVLSVEPGRTCVHIIYPDGCEHQTARYAKYHLTGWARCENQSDDPIEDGDSFSISEIGRLQAYLDSL